MCRLFAQLSATPASARDLLVGSQFSLLKQSDFQKENLQRDGWGVAWFGPGGCEVAKSPRPAFADAQRFEAASGHRSTAVVGHIRAASNPRGVPRSRLINLANTQPFTDGRWAFAHNGTLEIPVEVAARLGPSRKRLKSLNDSEVYFLQFLKFIDKLGEGPAAFAACVEETWDAWSGCQGRYPDKPTPYTSLNAVATDGTRLFAFCHAVRRGLASCGVCNPDQPWATMSLSARGQRLLVGSENLDGGSWTRLQPPEIVSARLRAGGRLDVERRRFEFRNGRLLPADPGVPAR